MFNGDESVQILHSATLDDFTQYSPGSIGEYVNKTQREDTTHFRILLKSTVLKQKQNTE